jgi:hypothetical protein
MWHGEEPCHQKLHHLILILNMNYGGDVNKYEHIILSTTINHLFGVANVPGEPAVSVLWTGAFGKITGWIPKVLTKNRLKF